MTLKDHELNTRYIYIVYFFYIGYSGDEGDG